MPRAQVLDSKKIQGIDDFIVGVLNAYKNGNISLNDAVCDIGHVIVAIDSDNPTEYVNFPLAMLGKYNQKN